MLSAFAKHLSELDARNETLIKYTEENWDEIQDWVAEQLDGLKIDWNVKPEFDDKGVVGVRITIVK